MGADGSQLCVWPGLWLRLRPGRDGEMEDRGKGEEAQSGSDELLGAGMEEGQRKRRASTCEVCPRSVETSMKRVQEPAFPDLTLSFCVKECSLKLCQGVDLVHLARHLPLCWPLSLSPISYLTLHSPSSSA